MKKIIYIFLIGFALMTTGCAPDMKKYEEGFKENIRESFGITHGGGTVEAIIPPSGPFTLVKSYHYYYKVYVKSVDETFWVEVSPSFVYGIDMPNYHYYTKTLGIYHRIYK